MKMYGFYNSYFHLNKHFYICSCCALLLIVLWRCGSGNESQPAAKNAKDTSLYLNHSDSARYVGMLTCKLCHQDIYSTFIETGMGKSFEIAKRSKSSGDFKKAQVDDKIKNLHYSAFWRNDSLYFEEFRLNNKDTVHKRFKQVNYIIGSGQHTNSHLSIINGYLYQMPMTYYTQKGKWDLPPGFENGNNTRFGRKIGLECMSCHNGYPNFVKGSENKYSALPQGIDCERCHGPGSIHVAQRSMGSKIDTSLYIDYSIVNPSKLSVDAQFDICQRCHLQGNAVLKENASFYDFKPGQKLSDFISVFLPKYDGADDEFIMASHADRLKQSACFIKSYEKKENKKTLKPYKEALTCITCHNPHVSVKSTNKNVFNEACLSCHTDRNALKSKHIAQPKTFLSNCVSCHMPLSGSIDIPHVSVHDHYIRKPITIKEKEKIKRFIGLYSVNEKQPDALTKAKAYINQFDKFESDYTYLDSAEKFLAGIKSKENKFRTEVQLHFIKQNFKHVIALMNELGEEYCFNRMLVNTTYDNADAWTAYRIAESFSYSRDPASALKWCKKSIALAPFQLDFRNKCGNILVALNRIVEAKEQFQFIIDQNSEYVAAYSNLGYLALMEGNYADCKTLYTKGEKLDPDNEALLLNLAAYYLYMKDKNSAKIYLERVIRVNPKNKKAREILKQLKVET